MDIQNWIETAQPVLAVYWQVYFDGNRSIRETFGAAGYPAAGKFRPKR